MEKENEAKILCVDDESNVLKALNRLFMDEDFELFTAEAGKAGLEILEKKSPIQVVVSDYRMPEMDGVEFLKQVHENWPETIRIVLSGYADTASVVEAVNEGHIYKFIPKPWNDDELKMTIIKAIDVYFLQTENKSLNEKIAEANEELTALNENLESLVEERTSELLFQNKVLTHAQILLDVLPIGVLGLDDNGMIAQCNKRGAHYLGKEGPVLVGMDAKDVLPVELLDFISVLREKKEHSEEIKLAGNSVKIKGEVMNDADGQRGIALFVDELS